MSDFELSVLPVSVKESNPELSVFSSENINAPHICPVNLITAMEALNEPSVCLVYPVIAKETISEQSVCPLPVNEFNPELSVCLVSTNESEFACSVVTNAPDFE